MQATRLGCRCIRIFLCLLLLGLLAGTAAAHPMGNFSINHYAKIRLGQNSFEILYIVDMAEIPTYQEMRLSGIPVQPDHPQTMQYVEAQGTKLEEGLAVEIDGQPVELATISRRVEFADGAGGLPTMKLSFVFRGALDGGIGVHKLSYSDSNFPGRAGWKEIVAVDGGATFLDSSVPQTDRSNELSVYSSDSLSSPPQQLSALVTFRKEAVPPSDTLRTKNSSAKPAANARSGSEKAVGDSAIHPIGVATLQSGHASSAGPDGPVSNVVGPSASTAAPESPELASHASLGTQNTPRSRFTELISTQNKLSFWFLLTAALIAMCLGALHALEPGHGKTIVAAYLVGSRGTPAHAVLLGIVVTAAHTAGVYALGLLTLYASRYVVPEQLYPWLGAISGFSVVGVGLFIFLKHLTGDTGEHAHTPGKPHSHWFSSLFKQPGQKNSVDPSPLPLPVSGGEKGGTSLRELCLLGISGGIVPCPAALVVLLSAFSLHRLGFGLFLITAFSLGLAGVLVAVGLTMVYAKRWLTPRVKPQSAFVSRLPLFSSAFMVILGVGLVASAFGSFNIGQVLIAKVKLVPFVTVSLLGLFLGMRHSTDSDHVVAVSTIVSRQKSIRSSAAIGLLWGLGHTLTIFLVGSAIIIFGVVIPPRLGLSMEFCVALMLILLGVLNLTGILRWMNERWFPGMSASEMSRLDAESDVGSECNGGAAAEPSRNAAPAFGSTISKLGLFHTLRPLVVGLVHGLAGSAAVALLVLSTIKDPLWSTVYLLVFGMGTMLGMMLMTAAISAPLVYAGRKFAAINSRLTAISGLASMAFGLFLFYHIGFVDGLFTAHVHWIPR